MIKITNPSNKSSALYAFAIGLLLQVKQECLLAGEAGPKDPNGLYAQLKELYDNKYRGIAPIKGKEFIDYVKALELYHSEKSETFIRKILKVLEEKSLFLKGEENRIKINTRIRNQQDPDPESPSSKSKDSTHKKTKEKLEGELKASLIRLANYFKRDLLLDFTLPKPPSIIEKTIQLQAETSWFSKQPKWYTILNLYRCDEKLVSSKRDKFKKFIHSPGLSLNEIRDVFQSYLDGNHSFFCFNSRHYLKEAREFIDWKGSVGEALQRMQEIMKDVKNKEGAFARRVDYLFFRHYGKNCEQQSKDTQQNASTTLLPRAAAT